MSCPKSKPPGGPHVKAPEVKHEGPTMIYWVTLCLNCGATLGRRMQQKPPKKK